MASNSGESHSADELPLVVFLMGATATGKTALAVELARRLPVEIISVDSSLVYRGMDIGTAKPEPEVLAKAPHRLIDICDASQPYSAGAFRRDAHAAIDEIVASGNIPLLVGGTGLYFRVLQGGLAELPAADPGVRAELDAEAGKIGWHGMHERLRAIDRHSAERIHPNDRQRIQRALEVFKLTGQSLTALHDIAAARPAPYRVLKFALATGARENLAKVIQKRFNIMMQKGFLAEVEGFFERADMHAELPSMRAVGYRQLWQYLEGRHSLDDACERAVAATRQLAKRQMTWLRSDTQVCWKTGTNPGELEQEIDAAG